MIAASIPGRTVRSCRARWFRAILPSLEDHKKRQRPGTWTEEQDIQLEELVMKYGRNWKKISLEMENRTPDACDIRWYGVICKRKRMNGDSSMIPVSTAAPNRRRWTVEEETLLWQLVETYGTSERAWPIIANALNRTCTSCKGHFYTVSSKRGPPPAPMVEVGEVLNPDGSVGLTVTNDTTQVAAAAAAVLGVNSDIRRRWTAVDEARLKQLVELKTSWNVIGATFNRTEEACKKHYSKVFPGSATGTILNANGNFKADDDDVSHSSGFDAAVEGEESSNALSANERSNAEVGGSSIPTAVPTAPAPTKWLVKSLKRWSYEEDEQLRQLVENYGRKNWPIISSKLPGRSSDACECRWRDKLYPKLLSLEKELREQIIQQDETDASNTSANASSGADSATVIGLSNGNNNGSNESGATSLKNTKNNVDSAISLNLPSNYAAYVSSPSNHALLTPQVRYTPEEDQMLKQLIDTYGASGQAAWDKITAQMPGRTVHSCRMRWKQALRHNSVNNTATNSNNNTSANTTINNTSTQMPDNTPKGHFLISEELNAAPGTQVNSTNMGSNMMSNSSVNTHTLDANGNSLINPTINEHLDAVTTHNMNTHMLNNLNTIGSTNVSMTNTANNTASVATDSSSVTHKVNDHGNLQEYVSI